MEYTDCSNCDFFYYEEDTNFGECTNHEAQEHYADVEDMTTIYDCPHFQRGGIAHTGNNAKTK